MCVETGVSAPWVGVDPPLFRRRREERAFARAAGKNGEFGGAAAGAQLHERALGLALQAQPAGTSSRSLVLLLAVALALGA